LYARFTLSFRDVEEVLAEQGLDISYKTIRRWFLKFGPVISANLRNTRPRPSGYWHLDEMVIVIRRNRHWLWRAVDNEGEILDFLVQSRRNARAAKKLVKKLLKKQSFALSRIETGKLRSYPAAFRAIGLVAEHNRGQRGNNRAENSHQPVRRRERKQQRFGHRARRNASSTSTPRSTTFSTTSGTFSNDPCTKGFEPDRSRYGNARAPPDFDSELSKLRAAAIHVTTPIHIIVDFLTKFCHTPYAKGVSQC
jgi:transposase-like protein